MSDIDESTLPAWVEGVSCNAITTAGKHVELEATKRDGRRVWRYLDPETGAERLHPAGE